MSWPLSQDYNEAIQDPLTSFRDPELRGGEAAVNALGLPMPRSGNFADVYEFRCAQTGNTWALKCFTRHVSGLQMRYAEISQHLAAANLPFTVDFTYLHQGIRVRGEWYPLLKMRWVEGPTLNEFVRNHLDKPQMLDLLCQLWQRLARRLREANVAHADLQHGNVLLVPGSKAGALAVKLIAYDGMWGPALASTPSGEVGHPAYQHPQRLRDGTYNPEVDRFPHLLTYTALRALRVGGRALWERYDNGDNLLFRQKDLEAPQQSELFRELLAWKDPETRMLADPLASAARAPIEQPPLLEQLAGKGQAVKTTPTVPGRTGLKQGTPVPAPQAPAVPVAPPVHEPSAWNFTDTPRESPPPKPSPPRPGKGTAKQGKKMPLPVLVGIGAGCGGLLIGVLGAAVLLRTQMQSPVLPSRAAKNKDENTIMAIVASAKETEPGKVPVLEPTRPPTIEPKQVDPVLTAPDKPRSTAGVAPEPAKPAPNDPLPQLPARDFVAENKEPFSIFSLRPAGQKVQNPVPARAAAFHLPYAYVLDRGGDLWTFRLPEKDEEKPGLEVQELDHLSHAGDGNALMVMGDTLLCSSSGSLAVFSLQDPAKPRRIAVVAPGAPGQSQAIIQQRNRVMLVGPGYLAVFDAAKPAQPRSLGITRPARYQWNGCAVGDRLYLAETRIPNVQPQSRNGISVIGVADPNNPKELAFVETPAGTYHLLPVGKDRLVALMDTTAQLFSLANPVKPAPLGQPVVTAARTGARLSSQGQSYLVTGSEVFRIEEKELVRIGASRPSGNADGLPYHGCSLGEYAAIPTDQSTVVLRVKGKSATPPK